MAKKPSPSPKAPPPVKRRRGRPPKPGGPKPQAEVQRAYRARLAAGGKAVRIVDTTVSPPPDAAMFQDIRDKLRNALLRLELREEDVARLEQRNAYLEGELKLQERHHTNTLKEVITLRQRLAKRR